MTYQWFRAWGWTYLPGSWQGIVVTLLGPAFSVQVFVAVDVRSHLASDTLYGIFPSVVPCWTLVHWVASKASRP